ncbi:MAG TPA: 2-dehydropantoate 2-reductase N-terminal domain-containing protein [Candidatus Limnocylindrales bacterium]|nr:2-dehydropantoate 2-reductase N-terminal domain-containing protein [Candidatus Limnocylindrales bacterium]
MILVIGAGAVGSFLGWTLASGGEAVELLRRSGSAGPTTETLVVEGDAGPSGPVEVALAGAPEAVQSSPEVILLAVKMPDLAGAIATAARWPEATVLAVQNGVGADELIDAQRRAGGLIAGSLTASVERSTDGRIRRLSRGGIVLAGVRGEVAPVIARLLTAFAAGGLRARVVADPEALRWSKLLVNLMGNASGAIVDLDPVAVYRDPDLFRLERRQLGEALGVMSRLNLRPIKLFSADARLLPLAGRLPGPLVQPILARVVAGGRGGKRPSLHLHLATGDGGPTEVEWLNGAVARAATKLGGRAPVNARLAELVEEVNRDPGRRDWFRGRPDRLAEAIAAD